MDKMGIASAVRTERHNLCDFLDSLNDTDWMARSLCSAWTVQEVVAHLTVPTTATVGSVVGGAIRARGNFDRMTEEVARERAAAFAPAELVQLLRKSAESSRRMLGSGPMDPLMDVVVHGQDIARPLKRRHLVPTEVVLPVLDYVAANRMFGGPKRLAGIKLVATDAKWSYGEGASVVGTAEELLLVTAGRPAGFTYLTGPGVVHLAERLGA